MFLYAIMQNISSLNSLNKLVLDHNKFKNLGSCKFSTLTHLITLSVKYNGLQSLGKMSFEGLGELTGLDLSWNNITHTGNGTFDHLTSLRTLLLFPPQLFVNTLFLTRIHLVGSSGAPRVSPGYPNEALRHLANLKYLGTSTTPSCNGNRQLHISVSL